MREIKFRGRRIDNGEWVVGYLREIWGAIDRHFTICPADEFKNDGWTDIGEVEVIPESIGQYTGLIDKHGKEIYEGNIFNRPIKGVKALGNPYVVTYENCEFMGRGKDGFFLHLSNWTLPKFYEVIGSLTNPPELLEEKK